jgi:universal stress protein E
MQPFANILVGVDVTQYDPATFQPSLVAREVMQQALWLGKNLSARLTFFSALDIESATLSHLEDADFRHLTNTVERNAAKILQDLVAQAQAQGIAAERTLAVGAGWLELIRQVLRERHDLVLIGTRDRTGLNRLLLGSTAVKVVRRCPCPVWVVKPDTHRIPLQILATSALKPVDEDALSLAVRLAQPTQATLHVLHVVDFPLDHIWSTGLPDAKDSAYRQRVRQEAATALEAQIQRVGARDLVRNVQLHLVDEFGLLADEGILRFIREHSIDLLVMATIGRGGLAGIMIGDTAERVLPELSCSLLTVKPKDFVSPVRL